MKTEQNQVVIAAPEFVPFPKIHRLRRPIVVTEKIDGTNACIHVAEDGRVIAGSRSRWISPEDDNFGFARWVKEHEDELRGLGPGSHFGEWWGHGIQRGYGLKEKRFSLFNVGRWNEDTPPPPCCHVVPVIGRCPELEAGYVSSAIRQLVALGSQAAPGFMRPEGVVVFHQPSGYLFKQTIEKDEEPKGRGCAA